VIATSGDGLSSTASVTYTVQPAPEAQPAPILSSISETARTWRESNALAQMSANNEPPVGTTFSFALNVPASVTFAFTRSETGRKVGKKCVAPTTSNNRKGRCVRTHLEGTLTFPAHARTNNVRFGGRAGAHKKLEPGNYTLSATATSSGGHSTPQTLRFTIVG
jgi:hypothetical protein